MNEPSGIQRDPYSNLIYILDSQNYRIITFPDGNIVAGKTTYPPLANQTLSYGVGLAYDSYLKHLIIGNTWAHNVIRWPLGATSWTLISGNTNGINGQTSTTFSQPRGVAIDSLGNIYVADYANHRVQFLANGSFQGVTIAGTTGIVGNDTMLLKVPNWVQVDNQLNLYVSDNGNNRIQKFVRY